MVPSSPGTVLRPNNIFDNLLVKVINIARPVVFCLLMSLDENYSA